jgi:predicted TIM-barrel fold metal-dependent hydrolase
MIVDFHCHAGRGEQLVAPWTAAAPLGAYLRRARTAGIGRTVVMPTFTLDSERANRDLARIVARRPDRLVGFAWIHPKRDAGRVDALVAAAVGRGFRGIKVHGHDAFPTREVLEAARRHRVPVLVDVFGRPHPIDLMAAEYPDVALVVAHLGSFADDWRAHQTVIDQLVRHPNVHADTSGVRRFDYLVQAVRRAGPAKLLFGSDGPWLHPGLELHKIRLLGLPPRAEALVLGGNAERLLARRAARVRSLPAAPRAAQPHPPRTSRRSSPWPTPARSSGVT